MGARWEVYYVPRYLIKVRVWSQADVEEDLDEFEIEFNGGAPFVSSGRLGPRVRAGRASQCRQHPSPYE